MVRVSIFAFLLATTGCGLSLSGLGDTPGGAGAADDAGSSSDDATSPGSGDDSAQPPAADGAASDDGSGVVADAARADAAPGAEGGGPIGTDALDSGASGDGGDARDGAAGDGGARDASDGGDAADGAPAVLDGGGADADALADASDGAPAADAPVTTCVDGIPAGWTLEVFDVSGSRMCPARFVSHDVSGAPDVGPTACSCDCSVTQDGDCTTGTLEVGIGRGNDCSSSSLSGPVSDGDCEPLSDSLTAQGMTSFQVTPLPPQGGTCSGVLQTDPTQLDLPGERYCDVPAASAESVCNGTAPAGFTACIAMTGQVPCPSGTPFVHASTVEDDATLQCTACTACSVATTCRRATLSAFSGPACRLDPIATVAADGNCDSLGAHSGDTIAAIEYTANADTTCTPGTSTASTKLVRPVTLCCR